MKRILSFMGAALIIAGLIQPQITEAPVAHAEPSHVRVVDAQESTNKETTPITEVAEEATPEPVVEPVVVPPPEPTPQSPAPTYTAAMTSVSENENLTWQYLMANGYTRNQAAGIMGNLMQEHGFKTSDHPNGLGIAQWMGNRRANLIATGNPTDINVQLMFLMKELNTTEAAANRAIKASDSLETATAAFQNLFERCNPAYCMLDQRISYAQQILARH